MISAFVLSTILLSQYQGSAIDLQWARTPVPWATYVMDDVDEPLEIVTSTITSSNILFRLPVQVTVSCKVTGGSDYYACWSQNPTASISSSGLVFGDDPFGVYTSGHGMCDFAVSGTPMFFTGAIQAMFRPSFHGGVMPSGARVKRCSLTAEPCADDSECSSGTCSVNLVPDTAYLFVGCADGNCACVISEKR